MKKNIGSLSIFGFKVPFPLNNREATAVVIGSNNGNRFDTPNYDVSQLLYENVNLVPIIEQTEICDGGIYQSKVYDLMGAHAYTASSLDESLWEKYFGLQPVNFSYDVSSPKKFYFESKACKAKIKELELIYQVVKVETAKDCHPHFGHSIEEIIINGKKWSGSMPCGSVRDELQDVPIGNFWRENLWSIEDAVAISEKDIEKTLNFFQTRV